ncbi:hypothetical protein PS15p_201184 [Mucor circinelloides]
MLLPRSSLSVDQAARWWIYARLLANFYDDGGVSDGRYDLLDLIWLVCILLNKGTLDDVIVTSLNQKATMYYI